MNIGFDEYLVVTNDVIKTLSVFKENKLKIYSFKKVDYDTYQFYLPVYQRYKVKKLEVVYVKTIGIIKYVLLFQNSLMNMIFVISFMIAVFTFHNFIFKVEINGNNPSTTKLVQTVLQDNKIGVGDRLQSYSRLNEIYDDIKQGLDGKVDYLNIYQNGSVLYVKYTNSVSAKEEVKSFENIYAKKDGVIKRIDVSDGNILVKENDFVKRGDLLVSNTISATNGNTKIIETKGSVYAYTYCYLEAKVNKRYLDEGEAFSYLLLKVRSQLGKIDKIDKEKVLSYGIIGKERILKMQYVLIEDIAIKGDINE